ncbi:MAG: sigma-70 family RNA polymerase sigma factor [Chitinophagales bacterium]|nr:sigma-70 family RNA polymerase sigma factor [Chitinophagales bacterium]
MDNANLKVVYKKEQDLESWVQQHTKELLSWAFYKTSDKMLAEDLVQDVFLVAAEKYESFKHDSQPKTWLFAILNNKIAEHYRRLSERPQSDSIANPFFNEDEHWKEASKPQDWADSDEGSLLDNQEFNKVFHHCIDELPDLHSACIRLKFINGIQSEVICQDLNITPSNYWQLLHRAKLQLRKCLEKLWFKK